MRKLLAALALMTAVLVPAGSAAAAPTIPFTSGTKCADSFGLFGSQYHVCGKVYGTGLDVSYVTFTVNAQATWCGWVEVTTPYENFWSGYGCAYNGGGVWSFHGTIGVGIWYASPGPLDIWAVNAPGYPIYKYPDGFAIT